MANRIEAALAAAVAHAEAGAPPKLAGALRHAVFPGGARVRPRLCLAVAAACGDDQPALSDAAASALELLHCASLVHDDLPCFDDAPLRRGRPSVHKAFGEPIAVLTGDALIVLAFETVTRAGGASPERLGALLLTLAKASGSPHGLVAGQAWESESSIELEAYHRAKTGSLFTAATLCGALSAGADPLPWKAMGARLGEAYQVADDLLDAVGDSHDGGKPTLRDAALARPSAVALFGVKGAVQRLRALVGEAMDSVPACPGREGLQLLTAQMADRLVPEGLKQSAA
jgi:geranylgeranyl diphosphate synthase, type II